MYKIISIDEEKESLPGYSPDKADDFHVESARNANKKFDQELRKIKNHNKNVILMCGGSASGKTEFIETFCPIDNENEEIEGIVFDSTLPTEVGAETKIKNIKKSGNVPVVCLILPSSFKNSFSAFTQRDRKIPERKFYETHSGARRVALFLAKNHSEIEILIYWNTFDQKALEENRTMFVRLDFDDSKDERVQLINFLEKNQFSEEEIVQLVIENK